MEGFFPQPIKLKEPSLVELHNCQFVAKRFDLSVYHLAYGTKPLRHSTIRRMLKRQDKINMRKNQKLHVKTPEERREKDQKHQWLNKVMEKVKTENLELKQLLPNGKFPPKSKLIQRGASRRMPTGAFRRIAPIRQKTYVCDGLGNRVINKNQSELGRFGTCSKMVKVNNSPFMNSLGAFPDTPIFQDLSKPKVMNLESDTEFPSLLDHK